MLHTSYALFVDPLDAARAKAELELSGTDTKHLSVVVHVGSLERASTAELNLFDTAASQGAVSGGLIGGVLGGALGLALLGPFGLVGGGAIAGLIFGTGASTVIGALMGGIGGSVSPSPSLEELSRGIEDGQVLLTVDAPSLTLAEEAERILRRHHARVVHRHPFRLNPTAEAHEDALLKSTTRSGPSGTGSQG